MNFFRNTLLLLLFSFQQNMLLGDDIVVSSVDSMAASFADSTNYSATTNVVKEKSKTELTPDSLNNGNFTSASDTLIGSTPPAPRTDTARTAVKTKTGNGTKSKVAQKAKPKPSPEELAVADFLSKLSVYLNDTLVAEKFAPPVDSAGSSVPYMSISDMLMDTPVSVNDSAEAIPNPVFLSIIFDDFEPETSLSVTNETGKDSCLRMPPRKDAVRLDNHAADLFKPSNSDILFGNARIAAINSQPELVRYSKSIMPEVPVSNIVSRSMNKNRVSAIVPKEVPDGKDMSLASPPKPKLWKHNFSSSVQFSQAYISENWYQGGESNFNVISDQLFSTSFDNKKKLIFTASVQWKLGVNTSPSDTCHAYKVNEDLFQINSKFGVKAVKDWYYTVSLVFKTQFFNSYPANSNDKTASLLSPGELNLGVGMSYNKKIEERKFETSIMLSPLSYNLKFALDKEIAALSGIPDEKLFQNQVGSSFEATFKWEFYPNLSWNARVFYFTNYKYAQSDIETGMDFAFNRYFSTKIYVHARYDDSIEKNKHGNYFQFKELLSFGFNYKFK